jgi:hypothetical protein
MAAKFYQILDVGLVLESDSPEFLATFDRDYCRFATPVLQGAPRLSFSLKREQRLAGPTLRINELAYSLKGHPAPERYACQLLNRRLFRESRDYVILHGAVVARENQALIISGPPGVGKTTLTLSLLASGLRFLSDDFCPVHKQTRLVQPFPRSLWVAGAGRGAARDPGESRGSTPRRPKTPIKAASPEISLASGPCRPKSLIFLDPGEQAGGWQELEVGLKRPPGREFLQKLAALPQVRVEQMGPDPREWRLRYPKGQGLTKLIRGLLAGSREDLWNVFKVQGVHPDFSREPVLTPIPSHEAAFLLLGELKQDLAWGPAPELCGPQPIGRFLELNELLDETDCYRLTPGRLEPLKKLALETLARGEQHHV